MMLADWRKAMRTGKAFAYDEAAKAIEEVLKNFTKEERAKIAAIAGMMLEANDEEEDRSRVPVQAQVNVRR